MWFREAHIFIGEFHALDSGIVTAGDICFGENAVERPNTYQAQGYQTDNYRRAHRALRHLLAKARL